MKNYKIVLLDFSRRGKYNKIVWEKYARGLKEARKIAEIPVHWSNNANCFCGLDGNKQVLIIER